MTEKVIGNAKIVLQDEIVKGSVLLRHGKIADISEGATSALGEDLGGDYLIPGLVELHTDHLEQHYHPRPGVTWPAVSAVMAHDAQIAASGITTVFDALRAGTFEINDIAAKHTVSLHKAIETAQRNDQLRAEHFIHVRCELPCFDTADAVKTLSGSGPIHLFSIMDHTPGARQFVSLDKFKEYYFGKKLVSPEEMDGYIQERLDLQAKYAAANKREIIEIAQELGVKLASHDDATIAHVEEAVADGVVIAEFPTTGEAAHAAHASGLAVMMGAPNVVRGGSHSGNISAAQVAAAGHLDVLSSDYVPGSLLAAAFSLPEKIETISLPQALRFVTSNPARAASLDDRGAIEIGRRADLVHVQKTDGAPVVRKVWRAGERVM
jgi:alpha-D-ribose 1-methylphosphonate 5-triphosphate diphosphatase